MMLLRRQKYVAGFRLGFLKCDVVKRCIGGIGPDIGPGQIIAHQVILDLLVIKSKFGYKIYMLVTCKFLFIFIRNLQIFYGRFTNNLSPQDMNPQAWFSKYKNSINRSPTLLVFIVILVMVSSFISLALTRLLVKLECVCETVPYGVVGE